MFPFEGLGAKNQRIIYICRTWDAFTFWEPQPAEGDNLSLLWAPGVVGNKSPQSGQPLSFSVHKQQLQWSQPSSDFKWYFPNNFRNREVNGGGHVWSMVTSFAPLVWLQTRILLYQASMPTQSAFGASVSGCRVQRIRGDDRTDNGEWAFSTPGNYCLCPGDKAPKNIGHVRSPHSMTAKASPSLPRMSVICSFWVSYLSFLQMERMWLFSKGPQCDFSQGFS